MDVSTYLWQIGAGSIQYTVLYCFSLFVHQSLDQKDCIAIEENGKKNTEEKLRRKEKIDDKVVKICSTTCFGYCPS